LKTGDMVRFMYEEFPTKRPTDCRMWEWRIGLLIEYHTWEKIAKILCDGKVYRVRAAEVQKAGKKDFEKRDSKI
jgi:hypothetical protein